MAEPPDTSIDLRVELDPAATPMSGRVVLGGAELDFAGWVGLAGAIEHAIQIARAAPGEPGYLRGAHEPPKT
jgi:hypothetical protein